MGEGQRLAVGELFAIARQVAARYGTGRPGVDLEDVAQEALAAVLAAQRALGSRVIDLPAYLAVVARDAVLAYVYLSAAPVRVSSDRRSMVRQAKAAERCGIEAAAELAARDDSAEQQLGEQRWAREVRQQLREVLAADPVEERAAVWRVVVEDETSAEAAAAEGLPVRLVYQITERAKRRLLKRSRVRALWRDLVSPEEE